MANPAATPALPWAHGAGRGHRQHQPKDEFESYTGVDTSEVQLQLLDRIEVLWTINIEDHEDDGTAHVTSAYKKWWPAIICGQQPSDLASLGTNTYNVTYEAFGTFSEQDAQVRFLTNHTLIDLNEPDAALFWRKYGSGWEPGAEQQEEEEQEGLEEEEEEEEEEDEEPAAAQGHELLTNDALTAFNKLEPYQQSFVAAGFHEMMEGISEYIKRKAADNVGKGEVEIDPGDVHEMFKELGEKRRRIMENMDKV